MGGSSLAG